MEKTSNNNKEYLIKRVAEFQNGDESAFGEIYHIIGDKLFRNAMYFTKDLTNAEDLLQDTMLEIIKSIKTLRDPSAFTSWSIKVMRNVYSHKVRKGSDAVARGENDLAFLESLEDEDPSYRPDLVVEKLSRRAFIKEVMSILPEEQRTTMILHYYDELSVKEISEIMDVPENTVKYRLSRGRKVMEEEIEKYEKKTGIRMHEFAPAPFIIEFMRHIFDGSNIVETDVLMKIFKKVLEIAKISATLPSSPMKTDSPNEVPDTDTAPDASEPDANQAPDDAPDTSEPDTNQAPDDAPDTSEPDTDQAPDDAPDTSEPDTNQAPDDAPDTSEPDTNQAPDDAPDTTEPDTSQAPDDTPDTTEPDTSQAPDDTPDTTEPDTNQAPDDAPDTSEPDTDQAPDDTSDTPEPDTNQVPDDAPDTSEPDTNQAPDDTPDTSEPDTNQAPDDALDTSEPDANQAPDDTPDISEPDTNQAPEDTPDTTEPDTNQAPDDTPDTTEHDTNQAPDNTSDTSAPDTTEPASNKAPNVSGADNGNRARRISRALKNEHEAKTRKARAGREQARRAARATKKALLLKILAATLGAITICGVTLKTAFPDIFSSLIGSGDDANAYSKAYVSVLSLYEKDIRGYKWQYSSSFIDPETGESPYDSNSKPIALKDIDNDGIPELFFMTSVYDDIDSYVRCADLHIFTFKNGEVKEVSYYSEYPNEYPAEYYDGWYGHPWIEHDGRMVHYYSGEPNTSFAVFTGKEENELYILTASGGSEAWDYRMRKYTLENSRLDITSDTYEVEIVTGITHSENPDEEIGSAIADMDEIVIYGGYTGGLGVPWDVPGSEANADAEVYGWEHVQGWYNENSPDIAPEMFQNSLCMTYDEAMDHLKAKITDKKKRAEDSEAEYVRLRNDKNIYQAGDMLYRSDPDANELWYIKTGETEVRTLSKDFFRSTDDPFTNGTSILYFDHSAGDDRQFGESYVLPLIRYDLETGETKTIHEFTDPGDPNASYYIGAVCDGIAYLGYDGGDNPDLWTCDLESGEITEMPEHVYIKDSYGKYVLTNGFMSLSGVDLLQTDIYELKDGSLEHVADLGSKVSNGYRLINGNIYYSAVGNDDKLTVYRFDLSDASTETLLRFSNSDITVNDYSEAYCLYYNSNFEQYKGTYKTENSYWIPRT